MKRMIALLTATSLLAACQQLNDSYGNNQNTYKGAGLGAALGAGIGALTGDGHTERRQRATVGAVAGAFAGMAIGQYMDRQEDQLRQDMAGSGVDVQRQGDNIILNMPNSITFAIDSSMIQSQFDATLNNLAATLKGYPDTRINVIGHTDSTGSDSYNQQLSERRALAVADYLRSQGVASERLFAIGRGETQPIASNDTESGRAQNRRVEVVISPQAN